MDSWKLTCVTVLVSDPLVYRVSLREFPACIKYRYNEDNVLKSVRMGCATAGNKDDTRLNSHK